MKSTTQYLFLLLFVATISGYLSSCSGDRLIWDFASRDIEIAIVDSEGYSLIEPNTRQGDKRLKSIKLTWDGTEYRYNGLGAEELRAIPEFYKGLGIRKDKSSYLLFFGEFQPHYVKSEIKIEIPGVGDYSVLFTFDANPIGRNSNIKEGLWVDGKKQRYEERKFKITLVVDRKKWEEYGESEEKENYLPVTFYFIPPGNERHFLESLDPKTTFIHYNDKVYPFTKEIKGDPIYGKDLLFYGGYDPFVYGAYSRWGGDFLAFGPFDPKNAIDKGEFVLSLAGSSYTIQFLVKLDEKGDPVYDASLKDVAVDPYLGKKMYFRNGQLIRLPR